MVVLGKARARWGYLLLILASFAVVIAGVINNIFPAGSLLILGGLPLAISATWVLIRHYEDRTLIRANVATIQLHALAGLLLAAGTLWSNNLTSLLGL